MTAVWRRRLFARGLIAVTVQDLAQDPQVPLSRAPDHHRRSARGGEHRLRACARGDVARCDHGHVDQLDELGVSTLLIRGFDPLADAVEYGRELIPLVRAEVARRDRDRAIS